MKTSHDPFYCNICSYVSGREPNLIAFLSMPHSKKLNKSLINFELRPSYTVFFKYRCITELFSPPTLPLYTTYIHIHGHTHTSTFHKNKETGGNILTDTIRLKHC